MNTIGQSIDPDAMGHAPYGTAFNNPEQGAVSPACRFTVLPLLCGWPTY